MKNTMPRSTQTYSGQEIFFGHASGKDTIFGFHDTDTLAIAGGTYSKSVSGNNLIITTDNGSVTLIDGTELFKNIYVETNFSIGGNGGDEETEENSWKLSGTTATYGTTSKTLIKVTGVKSLGGISLSGKVVTVAASALNKKKVKLSGSGYTLKLADDVSTPTTKKAAWAYKSGTATYKSSYKTAGYTLADNGKSITYSKATTAEGLATIKGAKSKSFTVSGKKITLKNASLKNKVTVSGGYEFNFASRL